MYLGWMGWAIRLSALSAKHGNLKYQLHLFFNCNGGNNFSIIVAPVFVNLPLLPISSIISPKLKKKKKKINYIITTKFTHKKNWNGQFEDPTTAAQAAAESAENGKHSCQSNCRTFAAMLIKITSQNLPVSLLENQ
ncbi:unnamed protein product [Prunus armeniaca]